MVFTTYLVNRQSGGVFSLPDVIHAYVNTKGSVATVGGDSPSLSDMRGFFHSLYRLLLEGA